MTAKPSQSAAQRAADFLRRYLPADGTPVPSADVQAAAAAEKPPIAARSVQRAVKATGARVSQMPGLKGRVTLWSLRADPSPPTAPAPPEVAPEATADVKPTVRRGELGRRAKGILNQPFDRGTHP